MAIQTVVGAFDDRQSAQRAVDRLVQTGCDRNDVHIEPAGTMSQGMTDATPAAGSSGSTQHEDHGVMASIRHFFSGLFGDDDDDNRRHAGRFAEAVRRGNVIVVVDAKTEQQADQVASVLYECDAIDVDERAEQWRAQGWDESGSSSPVGTPQDLLGRSAATRATAGTTPVEGARAQGEQKLDVVQEELRVGKKEVARGGVRVIQRVSEKPVHELVRLREERAVVDRHPVDREATAADLSNFREGVIEVRETIEEPVVQKTARVVEEVRVGKEVREREETIEGSVRRKDVEVERLPGEGMTRTDIERERAVAADNDLGTDDLGTSRDRGSLADRDRDRDRDRGNTGNTGDKPRKNL